MPGQQDENILCRHFADLCQIAEKSRISRYSGFLSEHEQALAARTAESECTVVSFWGGYDNAQRKMAGFGGDDIFPLRAVTFTFRKADVLSHRDFLGALMSLGIKRELVGDILVGEGYCVLFVADSIIHLLLDEITKIGRVGVKPSEGLNAPLPEPKFSESEGLVTSLRLDGVVSEAIGLSREKTVKLISSGLVQLNGMPCEENSRAVKEGDTMSARGYGKFTLEKVGEVTKKGKLHIKIKKFL